VLYKVAPVIGDGGVPVRLDLGRSLLGLFGLGLDGVLDEVVGVGSNLFEGDGRVGVRTPVPSAGADLADAPAVVGDQSLQVLVIHVHSL
jgi:hypothetical protein